MAQPEAHGASGTARCCVPAPDFDVHIAWTTPRKLISIELLSAAYLCLMQVRRRSRFCVSRAGRRSVDRHQRSVELKLPGFPLQWLLLWAWWCRLAADEINEKSDLVVAGLACTHRSAVRLKLSHVPWGVLALAAAFRLDSLHLEQRNRPGACVSDGLIETCKSSRHRTALRRLISVGWRQLAGDGCG